jgi:hypothetical protein
MGKKRRGVEEGERRRQKVMMGSIQSGCGGYVCMEIVWSLLGTSHPFHTTLARYYPFIPATNTPPWRMRWMISIAHLIIIPMQH